MSDPLITRSFPWQSFKMLYRLWRSYAQSYRIQILAAIPCAMLAGAAGALQAYLFQPAIDQVLIDGDAMALWAVPLAFLLVSVVRGLASYAQSVLIGYAAERVVVGLQQDIFAKLLRLDMAFFQEQGEAPQVGRFLSDVRFVREATVKLFTSLPKEILTATGMLCVLIYHSPSLSAVVVVVPLCLYPVWWIGRKMRHVARRTQYEAGRMTAVLDQSLGGLRQIKIAGRYADEEQRAADIFSKMQKFMVKIICYEQLLIPINEVLKAICFGFSIVFGSYLVHQGEMTIGAFTSFMIALVGIFTPIRVLSKINSIVQAGLAGMERTFALLDRPIKIAEAATAAPLRLERGAVEFRNVHFGYNAETSIVSGINLHIPGGSCCALVGASGAGKSTLLSMVPRFIDPQVGQVLIDGQDLRSVTLESVRSSLAYISQEIELFDLNLRENLRYACPHADDAEIEAVLRKVGLYDFIAGLPEGLETMIGERGVRLSGGQRQRVAFARALMRQAPIVLMDEATSALDNESERHIQQVMAGWDCTTTVLIIAHRLSTIRNADKICVLEHGRIVEQGNHQELLDQGGVYVRFYAEQFAER